jgi:hypothetical protein
MQVIVTGPRRAKIDKWLAGHISIAVESFARQLSINRLDANIRVNVHKKPFVDKEQTCTGCCEAIDARNFVIDIALYSNWIVALAHEMVHAKQFARDELDFGLTRWKSNRYCDKIKYWDQPWEKEARKLQYKLVENFEREYEKSSV